MLRIGLIGKNPTFMKLISKHLIYKHRFENYSCYHMNTHTSYVCPYVNSDEKYEKLKKKNFIFIKLESGICIPADYIIDSGNNLHIILDNIDMIIEKQKLTDMYSY
jgi:hypothetical protein